MRVNDFEPWLEQMDSVNLWSPETFEQIEATKSVDVSLSARDSRAIMSTLVEKADYSIQVRVRNRYRNVSELILVRIKKWPNPDPISYPDSKSL